jgi:hypothetical protein
MKTSRNTEKIKTTLKEKIQLFKDIMKRNNKIEESAKIKNYYETYKRYPMNFIGKRIRYNFRHKIGRK